MAFNKSINIQIEKKKYKYKHLKQKRIKVYILNQKQAKKFVHTWKTCYHAT